MKKKCPKCDSEEWETGWVYAGGFPWEVNFVPSGKSILKSAIPVLAERCLSCGFKSSME